MVQRKRGPIDIGVDLSQSYVRHLADGLVATDGVVYTSVATFGTTAVDVLDLLVDPGFSMRLKELEVGLTQHFTELTAATGSLFYYWQARSEYTNEVGTFVTNSYVNVTGTYRKGIGASSTSEDTFSGYINSGSVPYAPVRFKMTARGLVASSMVGKVKNSSYVKMVGTVIPGT